MRLPPPILAIALWCTAGAAEAVGAEEAVLAPSCAAGAEEAVPAASGGGRPNLGSAPKHAGPPRAEGAASSADDASAPASSALKLLDDFEDLSRWSAHPAEGVEVRLSADTAAGGQALRVDFRFVRGGGYAVTRRAVDLELPENYAFAFRLRGECRPNNLEFKLVDPTGENVWWVNRRDFQFPRAWETVTIKRRHIQFAWGPAGGGEIRRVAAIELAITAGGGGEGTVWLDHLTLRALEPPRAWGRPAARASSFRVGHRAHFATDEDSGTSWWSEPGERHPWLELDLGGEREFGGLTVDWVPGRHAPSYVVEASADRRSWRTLRTVEDGDGGRDHLYLPESEAGLLRIRALAPMAGGCAIAGVTVRPLEWASSAEAFFRFVAHDGPPGSYPRAIGGEPSCWTVVGVDGDTREGLLSQDGAIEAGKAGFLVEPFLFADGGLRTWSNVIGDWWLEDGYLPIPNVGWRERSLDLTITAFADGEREASSIYARYRVKNLGARRRTATLFLALRPFQVNPPTQFLNTPGGVSPIRELSREGRLVRVNGDRGVIALVEPSGFGASTYDQGNVVDLLRAGRLPSRSAVKDDFGFASGALAFRLDLGPGEEREVDLLIPLHDIPSPLPEFASDDLARADVERRLAACRARWEEVARRVVVELPPRAAPLIQTLYAQLGWILVNRDGPAIQPGSRSYERSWIRDGSLTSSALLRMGHPGPVREFAEWFAQHQYENGHVPCCVDRRGADPVPEHDSHGELIYLVAEYHRHTGDSATARRLWPHVQRAAAYLDSLRQQRRTAEYRAPGKREFFGLLPPSISHEGYSAKPMHSYWDDLFALRGFKDATYLARALGHRTEAARLSRISAEFERDLGASIRAAMARHRIDYVPGSADLGDFDATSTTIALSPVQAGRAVPEAALRRTFERYWDFFRDRRDGRQEWEAYTPYEVRNVGAFVRLGWRERAHELLDFFMAHRCPAGWAQWAEVVGRGGRPRFIGDMPHTWVGSDFVRSLLDLFAYEREADRALVVGAGVPAAWVEEAPGVVVRGLRTWYGPLDLAMLEVGRSIVVRIEGVGAPPGGVVVAAPGVKPTWRATVNGKPAAITAGGEVRVRTVPASVVLRPPEESGQ